MSGATLHTQAPAVDTSAACVACASIQAEFGAYLAGEVSGVTMAAIAAHLDACECCAEAFEAERAMSEALAALRHAPLPAGLNQQLRLALTAERAAARHLSWMARAELAWHAAWAPLATRVAAGSAVTVALIAGVACLLGAPPSVVQANDEPIGAATSAHFLYTIVPPVAVPTGAETPGSLPLLVEAEIGRDGRVYDYSIQAGPADAAVRRAVEANLLTSVFQPATVFGVAVPGRVMLTYTGITVKG